MQLTATAKKIITSRLYDKGIIINPEQLNNYIINSDNFTDNNTMYNFIVNNYGRLIIE